MCGPKRGFAVPVSARRSGRLKGPALYRARGACALSRQGRRRAQALYRTVRAAQLAAARAKKPRLSAQVGAGTSTGRTSRGTATTRASASSTPNPASRRGERPPFSGGWLNCRRNSADASS